MKCASYVSIKLNVAPPIPARRQQTQQEFNELRGADA